MSAGAEQEISSDEIEVWRWVYTELVKGRRLVTRHHLTEVRARATLLDPEKVEWSREVRRVPRDTALTSSGKRQAERSEER
jgi:hypothetical protein